MTITELLAHKKTRYLFSQRGWDFYACGSRFYKISQDIIIPVDCKDKQEVS